MAKSGCFPLNFSDYFKKYKSISDVSLASGPYEFLFLLSISFKRKLVQSTNNPQYNYCNLLLVLFDGEGTTRQYDCTDFLDSSGPELPWSVKIPVSFCFGAKQSLIFHFYNVGRDRPIKGEETPLAEFQCNLSEVVMAGNRPRTLEPKNKQTNCQIDKFIVCAEETEASMVFTLNVEYQLEGDEKEIKGRFLKLSKVVNRNVEKPIVICTTELVKSNQNPVWSVPLIRGQIGSKDDELLIEVFDSSSNGKPTTSLGKLKVSVSYLESRKEKVKGGLSVYMYGSHTFSYYFPKGYDIVGMVALEFPAPKVRSKSLNCTLQSNSSSNMISHLQVPKNIFEAIEPYDSDRRYHAWCFGRNTSISGETSSCVNLNLERNSSEVCKVQGFMEAFHKFSDKVVDVGADDPESLSTVISKASNFVYKNICHKYYVLLIIMDKISFNVPDAIDALVLASRLPMSVLIVGVGNGSSGVVELMKKSCADKGLGDTVLCIHKEELPSDEQGMAKALLKGIPKQLFAYIQKNGF